MRNAIFAGIGGIVVGVLAGVFLLAPLFGTTAPQEHAPSSGAQGGPGFTGMQVQGLTGEAAHALGQEKAHGVLVRDVELGSPANRAGILRGDLIIDFDGQRIDSFDRLLAAVGKIKAGEVATVTVRRADRTETLSLRAGSWPPARRIDKAALVHIPGLGLSFMAITQKVRDGFGLRWGAVGVVVTKVEEVKNLKHGIKVGEVIVQVNQRPVWQPQQVVEEIGKAKAAKRKSVLLLIEGADRDRNGYRFSILSLE
ncbi:MAG: PDZ domain-containing protein [Rhodospirillales bacterium]